jgi:hypothetical protein
MHVYIIPAENCRYMIDLTNEKKKTLSEYVKLVQAKPNFLVRINHNSYQCILFRYWN